MMPTSRERNVGSRPLEGAGAGRAAERCGAQAGLVSPSSARPSGALTGFSSSHVMALQRTVGNRATSQVIQRATVEEQKAFDREVDDRQREIDYAGMDLLRDPTDDLLAGLDVYEALAVRAKADADLLTSGRLSRAVDDLLADFETRLRPEAKVRARAHVARIKSFLAHARTADAPHADQVAVLDPGLPAHTAQAGGGDITVRTGMRSKNVSSGVESEERFSISYKGPQASTTRWLQFIWREVVVEHPDRGTFRVAQPITTSGGSYQLTTDPGAPNYNTDSNKAGNPFYEGGFVNNRTADATTIFDLPSSMKPIVGAQFDQGATKVTSRAHFTTYLVRDMKVMYKVNLDVEWAFTDKTEPRRTQAVNAAGAASALEPEQRKRLIEQYPTVQYLP